MCAICIIDYTPAQGCCCCHLPSFSFFLLIALFFLSLSSYSLRTVCRSVFATPSQSLQSLCAGCIIQGLSITFFSSSISSLSFPRFRLQHESRYQTFFFLSLPFLFLFFFFLLMELRSGSSGSCLLIVLMSMELGGSRQIDGCAGKTHDDIMTHIDRSIKCILFFSSETKASFQHK